MNKRPGPRARKIREQVGEILEYGDRSDALAAFTQFENPSLTGPLFSYFYSMDDRIRFRSVTAMGELVRRIEQDNPEKARIVMRRLMWNLNDESGGIGWGSCEAMGEILNQSPMLAESFGSVLMSYIDPKGNFLEHEVLQRGVLWGVGTYVGAIGRVDPDSVAHLEAFVSSDDPVKRGYAVRALARFRKLSYDFSSAVLNDRVRVPVFDGWNMADNPIAELVQST